MLTTCFATVIQIHGREEKNTLLLGGLELSLQQDHLPLGIQYCRNGSQAPVFRCWTHAQRGAGGLWNTTVIFLSISSSIWSTDWKTENSTPKCQYWKSQLQHTPPHHTISVTCLGCCLLVQWPMVLQPICHRLPRRADAAGQQNEGTGDIHVWQVVKQLTVHHADRPTIGRCWMISESPRHWGDSWDEGQERKNNTLPWSSGPLSHRTGSLFSNNYSSICPNCVNESETTGAVHLSKYC